MKIRQPGTNLEVPATLTALAERLRAHSGWNADTYVDDKTALLNDYFTRWNLSVAVVGLSGGIDSAVVAALAARASQQPGSPIARVVGVGIPVHDELAATHQHDTVRRGHTIAATLGIDWAHVDMTAAWRTLVETTEAAVGGANDRWARGQAVATIRTSVLYYVTSLANIDGNGAVVLGTTNRDEGAWLGYVGKASDACVDIQLISDVHKHQVYDVARTLGLDGEVCAIAPNGDMYDGADDTDVFGAPYVAVEIHHRLADRVRRGDDPQRWLDELDRQDRQLLERWFANLQTLADRNQHKYLAGDPAVHLELYEPGGIGGGAPAHSWRADPGVDDNIRGRTHGWFDTRGTLTELGDRIAAAPVAGARTVTPVTDGVWVVRNLLDDTESAAWNDIIDTCGGSGTRANLTGYPGDGPGSTRHTTYDRRLAETLWDRLETAGGGPQLRVRAVDIVGDDVVDGDIWRSVGLNPLWRTVTYDTGDGLWAHHDAPWQATPNVQSLRSVIICLAPGDNDTSFLTGRTDNWQDWNRFAEPDEQIATVTLGRGDAVVFDHRIAHQVPPQSQATRRRVVRSDWMFQRCGRRP